MPKPRPHYLPGSYYHFYNRSRSRLSIFREPDNYLFVMDKLQRYQREFNLAVIAYCLLPNHYHFLVRQDGEHRASLLPQRIFNSYSKAYNQRYDHSGTLFEGTYRVVVVTDDHHLLELCRYIHTNPIKHGFVNDPGDWPYTNYLVWVGERTGTLGDRDIVQAHFPTSDSYRQFVTAAIPTPTPLPDK